ncbi:MAG: glycerate kinase [Actinomycetia bacterium]|nr:glycerate kinase [Actinomycetes bacterium]MCP4961857.1 glycerate kinase [Actinomycetes bacterium]
MKVVAAFDKFRGSATALELTAAVDRAARSLGWACDPIPLADGGEGLLEVFGGSNRRAVVTGPLGDPVDAGWRADGSRAVIEMAEASGIALVGGAEGNDALSATSAGTGELIAEAIGAGARRVIVGVGGSACTDGGLGAMRAMEPLARISAATIEVACDVRLRFLDAATRFGPQKGASPAQVQLLERRLERLAQVYFDQFGIDVASMDGSGAAGGLAGGLAAVGARLSSGFDLVADEVGLEDRIAGADLVITGEGLVDDQSLDGKVVGGVLEMADELGIDALVICGAVDDGDWPRGLLDGVEVISLSGRFGLGEAMASVVGLVETIATEVLSDRSIAADFPPERL